MLNPKLLKEGRSLLNSQENILDQEVCGLGFSKRQLAFIIKNDLMIPESLAKFVYKNSSHFNIIEQLVYEITNMFFGCTKKEIDRFLDKLFSYFMDPYRVIANKSFISLEEYDKQLEKTSENI